MKRILSISATITLGFILMSAITIFEAPQNVPQDKKTKKHIKMVKVVDGKKTELDTIIEGENVFVWQGDTVDGNPELKWISKEDFDMDSLSQKFDFDIDIDDTSKGKVIILKTDDDGKKEVREFKFDGSDDDHVFMLKGNKGANKMIMRAPKIEQLPHPPHAMFFGRKSSENVIDLSDSGIISYKKKKLKGGREKITIIRNEVKDKDVEMNENVFLGNDFHPMIWNSAPGEKKQIRVIAGDDGNMQVFEDENVWNIKEGDGDEQVIEKNGKTIKIRKIKEGDGKNIEVKVEVEEEKENEEK